MSKRPRRRNNKQTVQPGAARYDTRSSSTPRLSFDHFFFKGPFVSDRYRKKKRNAHLRKLGAELVNNDFGGLCSIENTKTTAEDNQFPPEWPTHRPPRRFRTPYVWAETFGPLTGAQDRQLRTAKIYQSEIALFTKECNWIYHLRPPI